MLDSDTFVELKASGNLPSPRGSALKVLQQEWRTTPLWGVRDSGPYLHDGRAKTLKEAILAHAGESILSIEKFAAMPAQEQEELISFLNTLVAP